MGFFSKYKSLIAAAVIGVLAIWVYYTYWGGGSASDNSLLTSTPPAAGEQSQRLLASLADLRTIKLDDSVFKDGVFVSLQDFGTPIPTQPVGKRNPFSSSNASRGSASQPQATSTTR